MEPLRVLLAPLAGLHAGVLHLRHAAFDRGVLPSEAGALPTVVVGNLNVGGSGKTPFTEWLVAHWPTQQRIAVLSRGYGRSTKGFREVQLNDVPDAVGDEPLQIKQRYPDLTVAVCEDRLEGIRQLKALGVEAVILDDAFQHRRLQGTFNILLTPFQKPWYRDWLMPMGGLRDVKRARHRAQAVVVTKCPSTMEKWDQVVDQLDVRVQVHAGRLTYQPPEPKGHATPFEACVAAVAVSALAQPAVFEGHVRQLRSDAGTVRFRDHHPFSTADFPAIQAKIGTFENGPIAVLITAKDWTKWQALQPHFPENWRVFVIEIALNIEGADGLLQRVREHFE